MELTPLTAISPVDGRYRSAVHTCDKYFSEYALIRFRVHIEVEYLIALAAIPLPQLTGITNEHHAQLRKIYGDFSLNDAMQVKDNEKITNHDIKAVEYFLKSRLEETGLGNEKEFVHFALTSQDINNTAVPLLYKLALNELYFPLLQNIADRLNDFAEEWKTVPMLARTHGQPASPTRLGKEIRVFAERLEEQVSHLKRIPVSAKFGGATGNFNAHAIAYPHIDWVSFANRFVENQLGLLRQQTTTQIEHYDNLAAGFDCMKRINTILTDLNRDMWSYISMEYFKQRIQPGEVGSSVMPHKVNPIDFENSEGNLGVANALFEHLSAKLPISRLQRDLTDSTVLRNIGVPFAHSVIGFKSLLRGLDKLILNPQAIEKDLDENWAVVSEAIQTILRREGFPKPYEALKDLTRTNILVSRDSLHSFIDKLDIPETVKAEMKNITPFNYTGL